MKMALVAALCAFGAASFAGQPVWDKSSTCRRHQDRIVGTCFEVQGRANYANGTPSLRIWWTGTKRILGVRDEQMPDNAEELMRSGAGKHDLFDNRVYGDFLVCPYSRRMPGHMQFVCVARARNLHLTVRHD